MLRMIYFGLFFALLPLNAVDSLPPIHDTPKSEDQPVLPHDPAAPVLKVSEPVSETKPVEVPVVQTEKKEVVPEVAAPAIAKVESDPVTPKVGLESLVIPEETPHFFGARYYEKKSGGWGWIKKPEESWKQARWVAIQESPRKFHVPHRQLKKAEQDHEFQYKLLGSFADYQIYDPVRDELLDVCVIEGYESLGIQKSIDRKPGPPGRFTSKKSGAYTRRNTVQFEEDGF